MREFCGLSLTALVATASQSRLSGGIYRLNITDMIKSRLRTAVVLAALFSFCQARMAWGQSIFLCTQSQPLETVSACTRLLELPDADLKGKRAAFYERGNAFSDLRQFSEAVADYARALDLDPNDVGSLNNRGIAYLALGQAIKALADFDAALRLKTDYITALFNRSTAYVLLNNLDAALKDVDGAIRLDPNSPALYYRRAMIELKKGEMQKAIRDLHSVLALDASHSAARDALMKLRRPPEKD